MEPPTGAGEENAVKTKLQFLPLMTAEALSGGGRLSLSLSLWVGGDGMVIETLT